MRRGRMAGQVVVSIHALLAESDGGIGLTGVLSSVSIHALLAESDTASWFSVARKGQVSIHALLAESDGISLTLIIGFLEFLSTLSLRRATPPGCQLLTLCRVSIHALLAESDRFRCI